MSLENDTRNEDWLRTRSWDLYAGTKLVTTLPKLLYALGVQYAEPDEQKAAVEHFTKLPSWRPAPDELKAAVGKFLVS